MNKLIKYCFVFFIYFYANASNSMRRCMILPIKDSVGGAIGFQVFKKVENYLKASKWCYYQANSEIINTLGNYKNTLNDALLNPEVLKIISDKTRSGSLIKIGLESYARGAKINIEVIGANGKDIYFKENTELNTDEIDVIAQTVNNWLDVYEKSIPYEGRVLGVLGTQFTIDLGQDQGLYEGYEIEIVRPVRKKVHPLLKEIVDWKTMPVASAKVFHVSKTQAQARLVEYKRETLIQPEDWVLIKQTNANTKPVDELSYKNIDTTQTEFSFGKLGQLALSLNLGTGSDTISGSTIKKIGGFNIGIAAEAEVWATRNYWVGLDIIKTFGSFSPDEGSFTSDSFNIDQSIFKLKVGYKYLPLGFFYGPQVDAYVGYANYGYGLDNKTSDGVGAVDFSGLLFGTRGSVPLIKDFRFYLALDFIFSPSYEEEVEIYGEAESTRNFNLQMGTTYKYSPNMQFFGGFTYYISKAEFDSETSVSIKNTLFKGGAIFNF